MLMDNEDSNTIITRWGAMREKTTTSECSSRCDIGRCGASNRILKRTRSQPNARTTRIRRRPGMPKAMMPFLLVIVLFAHQIASSVGAEWVEDGAAASNNSSSSSSSNQSNNDVDLVLRPSNDEVAFFTHAFATPGIINLEQLTFDSKEILDLAGESLTEEFVVSVLAPCVLLSSVSRWVISLTDTSTCGKTSTLYS